MVGMSQQYSPRSFLRQVPNELLARYFHGRGLLLDVDFGRLGETEVEPIYLAWEALPEDERARVESDFQETHALACESGVKVILECGRASGEDLEPLLSGLEGFHHKAFWAFLERPEVFEAASRFCHVDSLYARYWRKRRGVPRVEPRVDAASLGEFEAAVSAYYRQKEGRGHSCRAEVYDRGDRKYFFVYPEDYATTVIEYRAGQFARRALRPAFELIFVYSREEGSLDVYAEGPKGTVQDLQRIFARTVLGVELGPELKAEKVYELNGFKDRNFQFVYEPADGIEGIRVKKLRLSVLGGQKRITLEADPDKNPHAVYDLMDEALRTDNIPLSIVNVTQVTLRFYFAPGGKRGRNTLTFDITYPNSCPLKYEGRHLVARRVLVASGIDRG